MIRFTVAALLVAALPLRAERVRVVVAVDSPRVSIESVTTLRADVITSIDSATDVVPWGGTRAFAAEIDAADLERLRRDPRVRAVSLDTGGRGALIESVRIIGADRAHAIGFDGKGVTVAVLDTGIDLTHPDFAGRIVAQQCFCDNLDGSGCCPNGDWAQTGPGAARDDNGHGTHVSGIVAGGGANAPAGVAPRANIVAVKVMDANSSFRSFSQIYRALEWIAEKRPDVKVINMSLGSHTLFTPDACETSAVKLGLAEVIDTLRARGVLIAASAGNEGSLTGTTMPACMEDVLGIGATYDSAGLRSTTCDAADTYVDEVACFSNVSGDLDLVAPGADIVSSKRGGGWAKAAGTSMAAPHVAGTLALMQQVSGGRLTAFELERILKISATVIVDTRTHMPVARVDAAAAVAMTPRAPVEPKPRRRSARH
ncbi:MAG TPA: S8 family serine peptidase [Thermoanaerobaculia bacterium]|nr:S8 family serine peptidase [Thermoanaerobaculia bacterium]